MYVGLILTEDGPKVLEYNARLGDPERRVFSRGWRPDAYDLFAAAANGHLDEIKLTWKKEISVSVVLASEGYPGSVTAGREISGLDKISRDKVRVFHGRYRGEGRGDPDLGRACRDGERQLPVTGSGDREVYDTIEQIRFDGKQFRTDIGQVDGPAEADGEPQ